MSKQETFTKEEVVKLMTLLYKKVTEDSFGSSSYFDWDGLGNYSAPVSTSDKSLYSSLLGQGMSLLESSLDKQKLEPAKTILRQLYRSESVEQLSNMSDAFIGTITNDQSIGYGAGWGDIKNLLHNAKEN